MRAIIFLVAALMAVTITVAAGATELGPVRLEVSFATSADAEWQTVEIPRTAILLTARFVDRIQLGFTSQGEPSLYVTIAPDKENPDLVFSDTVHGTVYWGPKAHNLFRGSYAQTSCEFEGDSRGGKIVFFLPPAKPEKFKIISYFPETPAKETVPVSATIPDGQYLRLHWCGEYVDDPIPVIDPRYPVRWEHVDGAPLHFSRLLYQWELWGEERGDNTQARGVLQPALPLGSAPAGQELVLQIELIPPVGEVTLYLLNRGISVLQSGYCPRIEMRICDNAKPQSAILTRHNGEWVWENL